MGWVSITGMVGQYHRNTQYILIQKSIMSSSLGEKTNFKRELIKIIEQFEERTGVTISRTITWMNDTPDGSPSRPNIDIVRNYVRSHSDLQQKLRQLLDRFGMK